jgi:hypothetical protein
VAFKSAHTLASGTMCGHKARGGSQLPHLDRLVQTATDQAIARRSKCHTVDAILVTLLAFETHNKLPALNIPDSNALIEGARCDKAVVGGNGDRGDTVLDGEVGHLLVPLQIPQTNTAITTTRSNDLAVTGKVERVDVLLVAGELMLNLARVNVPDLQ